MTFWDRLKRKLDITMLEEKIDELDTEISGIDEALKAQAAIQGKLLARTSTLKEQLNKISMQVEGLSLLLSKKEVKEFLDTLTAEA